MKNRFVVTMIAYDKVEDKACSFVLNESGKYYVTFDPASKDMFLNVSTEAFYGEELENKVDEVSE